jgi:protein-tyrosine phosphatase
MIMEEKPKIHTSENSPLRIAELSLGKGRIGLTLCPGKKDKEAMTGPCWRSMSADLQVVKEWCAQGAGIVVTLMEDFELKQLQVTGIGDAVRELGLRWWHMPVKDQYPLDWEDPPQWDRWTLNCALLRHFLHSGGRVLIHCRGGLGRTGTLAARLLMEEDKSMDWESAIRKVRTVRSHAIETNEQENYLREFRAQQDKSLARREKVAGLTQKRVEQLVRLFLEVPWAFNIPGSTESTESTWNQVLEACLSIDVADDTQGATNDMQSVKREILAALYDADSSSRSFACEYFDIDVVPQPVFL